MARHVLLETGIRQLGSKEKGFFYRYPDFGETVRKEKVLKRIEDLKVSPPWSDVHIARGPSAKVQAVGDDSAGRLQYVYSPRYRERKERESSSVSYASQTTFPRCAGRRVGIPGNHRARRVDLPPPILL